MKVTIVGGGNAGCFTALHYAWYMRDSNVEVELIHNPEISPEKVGQATALEPPELLYVALGFDWFNNKIHATPKSGVVYEGWGKSNDVVSHPFPPNKMAMHYCPCEMQRSILESGRFRVIESDIENINNIDADYIFDCRGTPKDLSDYEELKNPINAAIIGKPNWDVSCMWTRAVATPDGWTFIIPAAKDSPSYDGCVGYLYNSTITSKDDAVKNFVDLFDVDISSHINFNNYVSKNPIIDDRIFLNGNRLFFLEPLEATALQTYLQWARDAFGVVTKDTSSLDAVKNIKTYIEQVQNFVLWHYQFGSKYDTPFWKYAKTLVFKDPIFNRYLKESRKKSRDDLDSWSTVVSEDYAFWQPINFKIWDEGMAL